MIGLTGKAKRKTNDYLWLPREGQTRQESAEGK